MAVASREKGQGDGRCRKVDGRKRRTAKAFSPRAALGVSVAGMRWMVLGGSGIRSGHGNWTNWRSGKQLQSVGMVCRCRPAATSCQGVAGHVRTGAAIAGKGVRIIG